MADEAKKGEEGKEKKDGEVKPANGDQKPEDKETTVGDVINAGDGKKKETENQPETVPLAAHLELKKETKELRQALKDMEKKIDKGADAKDLVDDIDSLATEYNLDPKFLGKLTKAIEKRAEARAGEVADDRTKHITKDAEEKRVQKVFTENFEKAIKDMPEFGDIANRDDIFALSLLPKNANKTFKQLIEDTYGKAIGGKRTIEKTTPRGGKEPEDIDFDRAKKDTSYFKEIMSNPDSKKKYNDGLVGRIGHAL